MDTFQVLAEPTRRHIIEMIAKSGELSASDISNKFRSSPPAISQHLKVLRVSNLVKVEKRAQQRIYSINPQPLIEIENWLDTMRKMWDERFDALDKLLEIEKKKLL